MLRCSSTRLRVSAFSVFMHDLAKQGKLKGRMNPQRFTSDLYRKLDAKKMRELQQRASRLSYPALDAYNLFQRTYAPRLVHMTNKQRQRTIGDMWADVKQNGKLTKLPPGMTAEVKIPAKVLAATKKKTSAHDKVKAAGKKAAKAKSVA